jgi:uncharacterized protein YcbX
MTATIAALFRHPIKGFTPEKLGSAALVAGGAFPGDRLFAVENGPSGFDPDAPRFIPKRHFAVLAHMASVARVRTAYDETAHVLRASAPGLEDLEASMLTGEGRIAFAAWLTEALADEDGGAYRVIDAPGHRFLDHPQGHVSIINLASVRDLETRLGVPVDPLRFRANLYVEGWPAWAENDWTGRMLRLGPVSARVFAPIVRCAATMVDPATAVRDLDIPAALHRLYGHVLCGIYVHIEAAGAVAQGDPAVLADL